jgi:hypothetical protein
VGDVRTTTLAALLVALLAIPARADAPTTMTADLDGDGATETVAAVTGSRGVTLHVTDTCPSGSTVDQVIAGPKQKLAGLQLVDADGRPGEEVLAEMRTGPITAGNEDVRLVAWRSLAGEPCAKPVTLWRWSGPRGKPPYRGARYAGFEAAAVDITKNFPDSEVALAELFAGRGHPLTKPNLLRRTFFRLDPKRQRYVRYYRTVVNIRVR